MTEAEIRSVIAHNWLDKALAALEIAEVSLERMNLISCVNRMYYAAFYALSAVLAIEGLEYGKHTAVRAAMEPQLREDCRISSRYGDYYNKLFDDRLAGDYEPSTRFSHEEVQGLLVMTREFIGVCKKMVRTIDEKSDTR